MNVMEEIKAYVDGELSHERKAAVEDAIAKSSDLRRELEDVRALSQLLRTCVVQPEPRGLERTLEALTKGQPRQPAESRLRFHRYGLALTFALFLGIAAVMPLFSAHLETRDAAIANLGSSKSASAPAGHPMKAEREGANEAAGPSNDAADLEAKPPELNESSAARSPSNKIPLPQPALVRTAELTIRVESVQDAQISAANRARPFGGTIESSSGTDLDGTAPEATLTIRVPVRQFDPAIKSLRHLGKVLSESTSGQDVTVRVADSEARLRVLRASETSYVAMLAKSRKVDDSLQIRDRLDSVREEIESADATRRVLTNQAALSTITLRLTQAPKLSPPVEHPTWLESAWTGAANRMTGVGRWLVEAGMNLLVLAPIWLPIVIGLWWWSRRR